MISVTVRPMNPEDIPTLASWIEQVPLWQRYRLTSDKAQAQLQSGLERQDILLTADLPGQPACGFAWCIVRGAFGRSVYLRLIGVRPDCAGSGVGSALLHTAEVETVKISADLFLLVSDFNVDAQRFYQRNGYQQIGMIEGYVLPDVNELIFRKRLREG